jgi:5-methylcytosine-specific restriction endonuclease McrA
MKICQVCECSFEEKYIDKAGHDRVRVNCSKRCTHILANRRYKLSLKGKASEERYAKSKSRSEAVRRANSSLKRIVRQERYLESPKGRAFTATRIARRRALSTNPKLYALRVLNLHSLRESCVKCGAPYSKAYRKPHAIDHIVALCNGGADEWTNYQVLCDKCHKAKTTEDIRQFNNSKQEV